MTVSRVLFWVITAGTAFAHAHAATAPDPALDGIAQSYVKIVLAVGPHDPDYVDAYYGPAEWRDESEKAKRALADVGLDARRLIDRIDGLKGSAGDELMKLRRDYLRRQLQAVVSRVEMLQGAERRFDEESQALYDTVAPPVTEADLEARLKELDRLLPGTGDVASRYARFRDGFFIPPERLGAVFTAAIDECRRRTRPHIELPEGEAFTLEYVTGKSWSAYNWYKGGLRSVIQVNTDLPFSIDRAIDLACHEGYPGHHVYNVLLEKHLVQERGWIEYSIYPLFSPQSLIAEGTANYGIAAAFPADDRITFERDTLFPLAGLDGKDAARYRQVHAAIEQLDGARAEAARRYLDGKLDADGTVAFLQRYALQSADRARQQLRFFDQYRAYIINYSHGKELVRRHIESAPDDSPETRWRLFKALLASPRLPGGLHER